MNKIDEVQYYGGVLVDDLEKMAKTHIRSALSIAYGEGLLVGINRAKKSLRDADLLQASEPVAYRGSALVTSMADWTYEDTKEQLVEFGCTFIEPLYTSPPNTQAKLDKAREALNKIANPETINGYNDASIYRNISQTTLKEIE